MTIKFVSEGSVVGGAFKKKVLSNKSLTRRVRGLSGKEGYRKSTTINLYNGVTLVANTADINYTGIKDAGDAKFHAIRFFVRWQSIINSANRLIVFEDTQHATGADAVVADILAVTTDVFSAYKGAEDDVHPFSAKRLDKNLKNEPRIRIIKDMMWADAEPVATVDVIKMFRFDVRLNGRKQDSSWDIGVLIMSDQANTPIDIQYNLDYTLLTQ